MRVRSLSRATAPQNVKAQELMDGGDLMVGSLWEFTSDCLTVLGEVGIKGLS